MALPSGDSQLVLGRGKLLLSLGRGFGCMHWELLGGGSGRMGGVPGTDSVAPRQEVGV